MEIIVFSDNKFLLKGIILFVILLFGELQSFFKLIFLNSESLSNKSLLKFILLLLTELFMPFSLWSLFIIRLFAFIIELDKLDILLSLSLEFELLLSFGDNFFFLNHDKSVEQTKYHYFYLFYSENLFENYL